jgi:hypothetical protein
MCECTSEEVFPKPTFSQIGRVENWGDLHKAFSGLVLMVVKASRIRRITGAGWAAALLMLPSGHHPLAPLLLPLSQQIQRRLKILCVSAARVRIR